MASPLPTDPSLRVLDRFDRVVSAFGDDDGDGLISAWDLIVTYLSDPSITEVDNLVEMVEEMGVCLGYQQSPENWQGLKWAWEREFASPSSAFPSTWPHLRTLALSLPIHFPSHSIPHLSTSNPKVTFTSQQVACLLLHMLLLTIPAATISDAVGEERVTGFGMWYSRPCGWEGAQDAYSMAVMKYLRMVALSEDEGKGEKERTNVGIVSFELRDAGDEQWSAVCERCRDTKMADVKVELLGPSEIAGDNGLGKLLGLPDGASVIAANKNPGPGPHSTQEELTLGCSPPLCLVSLIAPTLSPTQIIVSRGSPAIVQTKGSGRDVVPGRYIHDLPFPWQKRTVLWIDALELGHREGGGLSDLEPGNVRREVRKAWTAFSTGGFEVVETGLWGCGAFGGDRRIKFLVQWIAAALAGVRLRFVVLEERDVVFLEEVDGFLLKMRGRGWTTYGLLQYLEGLHPCDLGGDDVFHALLAVDHGR